MAGAVLTGCDAVVLDGRGANEAHLSFGPNSAYTPQCLALSLYLGVFGQATTKDATTSRLWWGVCCRRVGSNGWYRSQRLAVRSVSAAAPSSTSSTSPSASATIVTRIY